MLLDVRCLHETRVVSDCESRLESLVSAFRRLPIHADELVKVPSRVKNSPRHPAMRLRQSTLRTRLVIDDLTRNQTIVDVAHAEHGHIGDTGRDARRMRDSGYATDERDLRDLRRCTRDDALVGAATCGSEGILRAGDERERTVEFFSGDDRLTLDHRKRTQQAA